jgi:hypothetical protein
MGIDFDKYLKYADTPTPKPMIGEWTLTAPDGRMFIGTSPIDCIRLESNTRIPPQVALGRIARSMKDDFPDDYEV